MYEKTMQKASKRRHKSKNIAPFDHFEHMMGIYAVLVTPKSENVENVLVLPLLLKGQGCHEEIRKSINNVSRTASTSKHESFD